MVQTIDRMNKLTTDSLNSARDCSRPAPGRSLACLPRFLSNACLPTTIASTELELNQCFGAGLQRFCVAHALGSKKIHRDSNHLSIDKGHRKRRTTMSSINDGQLTPPHAFYMLRHP
jgi:DNA polymerase/3'-5' exonuclease PolX